MKLHFRLSGRGTNTALRFLVIPLGIHADTGYAGLDLTSLLQFLGSQTPMPSEVRVTSLDLDLHAAVGVTNDQDGFPGTPITIALLSTPGGVGITPANAQDYESIEWTLGRAVGEEGSYQILGTLTPYAVATVTSSMCFQHGRLQYTPGDKVKDLFSAQVDEDTAATNFLYVVAVMGSILAKTCEINGIIGVSFTEQQRSLRSLPAGWE